jgi:hypothetical protein
VTYFNGEKHAGLLLEIAVIVVAAAVALTQKHRVWLSGIALGLLIHAALLLAFDLVAERRGAVYLEALRNAGS